jgi:hypothetical protein
MSTTSSLWLRLLLAGIFLVFLGGREGIAQTPQGQYPQSQGEQERGGQSPRQAQVDEPLVHGLTIAAGLAIYQGDYSLNPNHNLVKYIAGNGKLSFRVGADHRLGRFDQYGLGVDLVYNRLSGETTRGTGFKANSVALDFYADYELPYISEGLFRVFIGGGPNLLISPSYTGSPIVSKEENFQELGTRVIGSLKVGVTILDAFRIGTRVSSSDLLDGFKGYTSDGVPDFVSFLNIGYRFNLK